MQFTLKRLHYFVTAGELNSVTKAAEVLHVSQPSISSAILHLEEVTGLQLFVRHHAQGLSLTPSGQQFILKAKQLLADADGLAHYARSLSEEVVGSINVAGFPTFAPLFFPGLLQQFQSEYPGVRIRCEEMHQKDIIQGITSGRFELALTYDLQLPAEIEFHPLVEFPPYAMLGADHPLAGRKKLSLKELAPHPMVILDWPISREYFVSLFMSQGLEPIYAFEAQSADMVRGLVGNGLGYSLGNAPLANLQALDGTDLRQIPLKEQLQPLRMGVARLADMRLTRAAEAFINKVEEETRNMFASLFPRR